MGSAVLEETVRTPAVQEYLPVFHEPTLVDSVFRDLKFPDARSITVFALSFFGELAIPASAAVPVQAQATFGQVRVDNTSTVVTPDLEAPIRPAIGLSAEEHHILRQAIWDSAEVVAKGRLVEP
jgi:hypothetical protein